MDKASGGDGIPVELFQILSDAMKVLHSICQQIWKTQQWPQDWKRSVFIKIPKKGNAKECSNYCKTELISYTSKGGLGNRAPSWVGVQVSEGPIQPEDIDEDGSLRDGVAVPGPWGSGEGSGLDLSRGREWPG